MEIFDIIFWVTWFLAGAITGLSGMGGGMLAIPVLSGFMTSTTLFPVACLVCTVITIYMAWLYHKDCSYPIVKRFLIGAVPGAFVGVNLLLHVKAEYIQLLAGSAMLFFVYLKLWHSKKTFVQGKESLFKSILVGFGSGVLNTSISIGNPPLAAYALQLNWTPAQAIGIMSVFGTLAFLVACTFQASAGLYTAEIIELAISGSIAAILGVMSATPFGKKINQKTFQLAVLLIIAGGGITCVWRGLTAY